MLRPFRLGLGICAALVVGAASAQVAPQQPDKDAAAQAQRQQTQPLNNAPVWREIRSGEPQYTSIKGRETNVLIQSGGETWRQIRNGPMSLYGGLGLAAVLLAIGAFYAIKGPIPLHEPETGRKIERFTPWERIVHWANAISFCTLAISGLIMFFGKWLLLPVIGYTLFSGLTGLAKILHNFTGPVFIVCALCLFITFVKDNFPRAYDWLWIRKFGGLLSGHDVPSHRFNAGEKIWFWGGLSLMGIVVGTSGLVLDFPNFNQTRATMQWAWGIHVTGALMFMMGAFGHIYMGTLGMKDAYKAMRTGWVDETWAKEHHLYWYEDIRAGNIPAVRSEDTPRVVAKTAH